MKRISVVILLSVLAIIFAPHISNACFDTYLFMQGRGMVYPHRMLAFDGAGEYIVNDMRGGVPDLFTGNLNVYYGLVPNLSVQGLIASSEKERSEFGFDEWGARAVYGLIRQSRGIYNLDFILECHSATDGSSSQLEFSTPNIWHLKRYTIVAHPVAAFGREAKFSLRGHGGVFYRMPGGALLGLGAEYESAQSSSSLGKGLVDGEYGTSLFAGFKAGRYLYLQNELIKGWGAGADRGDVGFALTLKVLIPNQ